MMWFWRKKPRLMLDDYIKYREREIRLENYMSELQQRTDPEDPHERAKLDAKRLMAQRNLDKARTDTYRAGVQSGLIEEVCW